MITLKIKKSGYTVDIPGLPTCRSPVEFDISKLDIRVVAMSLKTAGISEYEIVADIGQGVKEVYTKNDFEVKEKAKHADLQEMNKRFNKLEKLLTTLLTKQSGSSDLEKEQITDKLNKLEKMISQQSEIKTFKGKEPEIEEFEAFIPDVDTSKMKIESKNLKTIKQDSQNLDDTANILSSLMKK